ncbi:ABC transporter substrate-binding protein [Bacteriovoracales bacterium]|nr:ABC transporter substrate-binding protein [Bacteriovoracales bacterium]
MKKLFAIIALISFSTSTFALTDLKWWTEEYGPYNYRDASTKKIEGISIELLEATHKELGVNKNRKNYKLAPWARGYKAAQKSGKMNVIFSTTRTGEREPMFKWFGPVAPTKISLFGKAGIGSVKAGDIRKHKSAGIRGDIGILLLQSKDKAFKVPKNKIVALAKVKAMFKNVAKGKTKFFAYEENVAKFSMAGAGFKLSDFEVAHTLQVNELWYAVNKSVDDATVQAYQDALDKVKGTSAVKAVLKKKFDVAPVTKAASLFSNCGLTQADQSCKK